jgi:putative inorganic carbon (hco3(-)) transporter
VSGLKVAVAWIASLEPGIVILTAPFLMFPTSHPEWTVGALVTLLVVWVLGWIGAGHPGARTPLDDALLLLVLMIPIAAWASTLPELTLPKLTGLILGLTVFRATVNAGRTLQSLSQAVALFLMLGLGMALLGLVGTAWANKVPALEPLLARTPRLVQGLSGAETGINPNELGGTLVLFLPVSLAVCQVQGTGRKWMGWVVRAAGLLSALFFGIVLVLTQSRSAWLGVVVGLGVMAWIRWRWARWLMLCMVLVLVFGIWHVGPQAAVQAIFQPVDLASAGTMVNIVSLEGRLELWNRAICAIHDFPVTGCGLGTFRQVVHILYPLSLVGPDTDVAHAHNVLLQVALDLGVPGLIAYLALVGTALWACWRVARSPGCKLVLWRPGTGDNAASSQYQWLALGIVGSLVAFHVYGLTDTIALGAKPGVAFWMLLGLAAALWCVVQEMEQRPADVVEPSEPENA